ncbi:hypothetical protein QZH41_002384 [Actinostola sp. cb2023]|nr:hypothetical protein QZH41_002384 [Actinostola sp. cb2023]
MPNQEAVIVATKVVEEFVSRFGVPRQLHSDQGRNFESAVFREMCSLLGIDKIRTTPLHPQSDGMVERYNRTLEAMLSKFVSENQRDWDEHLQLVMKAYRTATHETTGFSPSAMMLGREITLPIDLLFGRPETGNSEVLDKSEYVQRLRQRIEVVHNFARDNLKLETDRQKKYYDHRGVHHNSFNRGDPVWLHNPKRKKGRCPKLQNNVYEGPFLVVGRLDDLTFRIQKGPKTKPKVVHHNRLKKYEGNNAPSWINEEIHATQGQEQKADAEEESPVQISMPMSEQSEDLARYADDMIFFRIKVVDDKKYQGTKSAKTRSYPKTSYIVLWVYSHRR